MNAAGPRRRFPGRNNNSSNRSKRSQPVFIGYLYKKSKFPATGLQWRPLDLSSALRIALAAAREAGDILRVDFHRPAGPRGKVDKADADVEAESLIRARLQAAFPQW